MCTQCSTSCTNKTCYTADITNIWYDELVKILYKCEYVEKKDDCTVWWHALLYIGYTESTEQTAKK